MSARARATVSIILPTFNRARYLPAALDSLLGQSLPAAELIVVNDGSSDETSAVLAPYRNRIVYLAQPNAGKSAALNSGLRRARGDYIWVFDDDDIACPDALERHLAVLEREHEVGFTLSGSYRCNEDPASGALRVERAQPLRPFVDDDALLELLLSSYVAGPSSVIRSSLLAEVGPFREDLVRAEDFEMALRLSLRSRAARLDDPRPTYYRRWHSGPRGPQGAQFEFAESVARSRTAERLVLRDLAAVLLPSHYLPRSEWQAPQDDARQCRAQLRRWAVAVQKSMWPEAASAFLDLRACAPILAALPRSEMMWACRAFSDLHALAELRDTPQALRDVATMLREPWARPLRQAALRQMGYHLRAGLQQRELPRLRLIAVLAWPLFGRRSLPAIAISA